MFNVGDRVRIVTGLWGGRAGTVVGVRFGGVHTVEFTAPQLILRPDGPQEVKRLPYAAHELRAECDGSGRCPAPVHIHGCFADLGSCEEPGEHAPDHMIEEAR